MVKLDTLFEPRSHLFETSQGELLAVSENRKALAWYPMTRDQIESYSDYDDLLEEARSLGLSVVTHPREDEGELDVFVLRSSEIWRAEAFRACRETLGRYEWSDASEYLSSYFLGYSDEQCRSWIEDCRYNRLGWVGQTVYAFVDDTQLELLSSVSLRCFPGELDSANLTVIAHPDGYRLRRDLGRGVPPGSFLCRFALANAFFLRLFEKAEPDDDGLVSVRLGVGPAELNSHLVASIEWWADGDWRAAKVHP